MDPREVGLRTKIAGLLEKLAKGTYYRMYIATQSRRAKFLELRQTWQVYADLVEERGDVDTAIYYRDIAKRRSRILLADTHFFVHGGWN